MRKQLTALTMLMVCAGALTVTCVDANAEPAKRTRSTTSRPISNPKFDPAADRVALFDGMEAGQLETKVIANGAEHGTLLITNTTDEPLTVEMPSSFVTVHVLKQFGQGGGGFGQGGGGGFGQGGGGQQGGGQQAQGGGGQQGGLGGGGLGGGGFGGGQQGGGGGFFSIPPEKTVKYPYKSVCLEHGKPDPTPRANRIIVRTEDYTKDPVLQELITMVASGRMAPQAAQAAVWSRTDKMSWQQLAAKYSYGPLGNKIPYFSSQDLQGAQLIAATAEGRVRERGENPVQKAEDDAIRPRGR